MTPIPQIDPDKRLRLQTFLEAFRFASLVAALTLFSAPPLYAYAEYSGASRGADGTVYGWSVTNVTSYTMRHDAYVSAKLTSPKGRVAWLSEQSRQNYIREDVSLAFDPNDLGTFVETGTHRGYCYAAHVWILLGALSQAQVGVVSVTISGPVHVPLRAAGSSGPNSINLTATGIPSGGTYSWSTTSGYVSLGGTGSATVTVTSQAASGTVGDVPVRVTYTNVGSNTATQYITVQKPTYLVILGPDTTTSEAPCTVGSVTGCGVTRTFKYEVLDQIGGGIPIQFSMPFYDVICTGSPNGLNLQGYRTTCSGTTGSCAGSGPCGWSTYSDGTFNETLGVCAPACESGSSCVTAGYTAAAQTWYVNGFALRVQNLSYQCNKILVNGG